MKGEIKKILFIVLLFLTGCATHLERNNTPLPKYIVKINKECKDEKIIVIFKTSEKQEGLFIKIDENVLAVEQKGTIVEYPTEAVAKIKYGGRFSPSGLGIGAGIGLTAGLLYNGIVKTKDTGTWESGATNEDKNRMMGMVAVTALGGLVGALTIDNYNTISLVE